MGKKEKQRFEDKDKWFNLILLNSSQQRESEKTAFDEDTTQEGSFSQLSCL